MVSMRSRDGLRSSSQPRATSRAHAACSSGVGMPAIAWPALAACSAARMRCCISAAALRVKVIARISSGASTAASSARKRAVSTVVLPEPAGACSSIERWMSSASRRARWSACSAGSGACACG